MESPAEPPGSVSWRYVILDPGLNVVAHGQRGPWPAVGDINAAADEIMAERVGVILRDGRDVSEMAGLVCRVWQGGVGFNADGEPVDEYGDVLPYGKSQGDDWVKTARAA